MRPARARWSAAELSQAADEANFKPTVSSVHRPRGVGESGVVPVQPEGDNPEDRAINSAIAVDEVRPMGVRADTARSEADEEAPPASAPLPPATLLGPF